MEKLFATFGKKLLQKTVYQFTNKKFVTFGRCYTVIIVYNAPHCQDNFSAFLS
jgi:hypothetical protein